MVLGSAKWPSKSVIRSMRPSIQAPISLPSVMVVIPGTFTSVIVGTNDNSPGRFFAVPLMKLVAAYILLRYDLEVREKKVENQYFQLVRIPRLHAEVLFRKLRDEEIRGR